MVQVKKKSLKSPVLLICYKRHRYLKRILNEIIKYGPPSLFIACDGPKTDAEAESVALTRDTIKKYGGKIPHYYLYHPKNLGCGVAVKYAIDWFFTHNDEGIILEDDTLPNPKFFTFIDKNLKRYRNDSEIGTVNGFCPWPDFMAPKIPALRSDYFSMWGWGTWARVWNNFTRDITENICKRYSAAINNKCLSSNEKEYWQNILQKIKNEKIDTWDYHFMFFCWANGQSHIRPSTNYVENLGFGRDATHTGVEPWFIQAQKTPLRSNVSHWFLEATYFYFRHLAFLDNFSAELVCQEVRELKAESLVLKKQIDKYKKTPFKALLRSLSQKFHKKSGSQSV